MQTYYMVLLFSICYHVLSKNNSIIKQGGSNMKKKVITLMLALMLTAVTVAGCGNKETPADTSTSTEINEEAAKDETASTEKDASGKKEVLEFYHGYFHEESEWAPAKAMRDIYDEFANQHANGPVEFKAIATEDVQGTVDNNVAGGKYPDIIDLAGNSVSMAAMSQELLCDMKGYIDQEGIQDKVGLNYTQNDVGGKIFTVHDQLLTLGFWYNTKNLTDAGATMPDTWKTWQDFETAMTAVREKSADGNYAYGAGQGSLRCFNAMLGQSANGVKAISSELTVETIESPEFQEAFTTTAKLDQQNGSANASVDSNDWSADFNTGKSAVFFNGVWAAGGFGDDSNFQPAIFPGGVALSSAGGGITIANGMSEEKTKLALEFVKYMTSDEVQEKIFTLVGANPCNSTLDLNQLAEGASPATVLLAQACAQANSAATIVPTIDATWGKDISDTIANKLVECTVTGVDVDAKFEELKGELTGLIG